MNKYIWFQIIKKWEFRRLIFNLIAIGLFIFSNLFLEGIFKYKYAFHFFTLLFIIVINILYTLIWVLELFLLKANAVQKDIISIKQMRLIALYLGLTPFLAAVIEITLR